MKLGTLAEMLEKAGNEERIDVLEQRIGELIADYRQLAEELAPLGLTGLVQNDQESKKMPIDPEKLRDLYRRIRKAAVDFDTDVIDECVEEMERFELSPEDERKVQAIRKAAAGFDYDVIMELL